MNWLQGLLQRLFMRVEAMFNAAFGDRLNPLYQLGAISFFLFWIVAGSGLYLYAFFETSVTGAYASVESLTHDQWYAGGLLRSLHRYSSDAMVLTMLLHALRHFAFDRFRGFRWFSWVSGVGLIYLVYVSGINGYMLPWDKLAQFVTIASFEAIDALPGFGGTLMRNFIYPSSVSDRLFSLLSFMHIGIPLLVLLMMWIHVQRVPKASTNPKRPIMLGLALALVALSVLKPAMSQGGAADLGVVVGPLQFDWLLLPALPLFYQWSPGQVWAVLVGATALLGTLPWLPPRLRRNPIHEFHVTLQSGAQHLTTRAGETLLEAGLRQGLALPYDCRNGNCGVCRCKVLQGKVDHGHYQPVALPEAQRARGEALLCCATPLSDLVIEVEWPGGQPRMPIASYVGCVEHIEHLSDDVIRLLISLQDADRIAFVAGQYINIVLDGGQRRAFSFANPPHENTHVELHVRRIPGGMFTTLVFERMRVGDRLHFEGPLGNFTLVESVQPILFVAGATGFAPIKSIVEDAFHRGIRRPMRLYWGTRKRRDLYMLELAQRWQREHPNFEVIPVLSEASPEDDWHGRRGLVHEAILSDFPDLRGHEVYVCGSMNMVDNAVPAFIAQGLSENSCFSDAFRPSGGFGATVAARPSAK